MPIKPKSLKILRKITKRNKGTGGKNVFLTEILGLDSLT